MNLFRKIFGYRTDKAASGSLTHAQLSNVAHGTAAGMKHYGASVTIGIVSNTNSMLPTFDANALLLLEEVPFDALREGDIATRIITLGEPFTVHRLNEKTKSGWMHLGDNNGRYDSVPLTPQNYHRRVCGILYGQKNHDTDL